jgi:hypothetical protein
LKTKKPENFLFRVFKKKGKLWGEEFSSGLLLDAHCLY